MSELQQAVLNARTAPDILASLARLRWAVEKDGAACPEDHIPTVEALAQDPPEWPAPDPAPDPLEAALALSRGWTDDFPLPRPRQARRGQEQALPASETTEAYSPALSPDDAPILEIPDDIPIPPAPVSLKWAALRAAALAMPPEERTDPEGMVLIFKLYIERLHADWLPPTDPNMPDPGPRLNPFAPIVRAWLARPTNGATDGKANAIIPAGFAIVRDLRSEQGTLFGELPTMSGSGLAVVRELDLFGSLPGFEPAQSAIVPSLPLVLFDATGEVSAARGRGAPLPLRVWVECVLWGKLGERSVPRRLVCTLREFIAAVWPNRTFRPSRDGEKLLQALHRVHNARVPWTDPKTERPAGYWAAATVTNMPELNDMNSSIVFEVSLPPGSEAGPMIHRPTLRKYGVISAPAYRSSLGLAYLWNRHLTHNGKRLPPTVPTVQRNTCGVIVDAQGQPLIGKGGQAVTHWGDKRAVRTGDYERNPELERLPWLQPEDLLALAFPEANLSTKQARSDALRRTREALCMMANNKDLVIVKNGRRWRLEPPDWWGAPGGNTTRKRLTR
ncbi:MAG: hypothetical protein OXG99_17850 [Alphaproteobacteria bacterium]|nr:hypothetical protein [Alphaproteobacteria bacterium]